MTSPGTGLALPTERVTLDPPEFLLYLVEHRGLRHLYQILGPLRRSSTQSRRILEQSLANGSRSFPLAFTTPARVSQLESLRVPNSGSMSADQWSPGLRLVAWRAQIAQAVGPARAYSVQAESPALQGRLIKLAMRSATEAFIAGVSKAPSPDWRLLAGREIRAWAQQHEAPRYPLPGVMFEAALGWRIELGKTPVGVEWLQSDEMAPHLPVNMRRAYLRLKPEVLPGTEAPAGLNSESITRLFLNGLDLPEKLMSFELEELLGVSDVAASFRGQPINTLDGPSVVIKILRPPLKMPSIFIVTAAIRNLDPIKYLPGVLSPNRVMKEGDYIIIVVDYMPHGNLSDVVSGLSGSRRIAMILRALVDVCEALTQTHGREISHGRINPRNILFDGRRFRLADFVSSRLDEARREDGVTSEPTGTTTQRDIHDLGVMSREISEDQSFDRPSWLTELIERSTSVAPPGRPSAADILNTLRTILPSDPSREDLAVLRADREGGGDGVHYGLDIGGQRVVESLRQNVSDALIGDLCALWDAVEEVTWGVGDLKIAAEDRLKKLWLLLGEFTSQLIVGPDVYGRLSANLPSPLWLIHDRELGAVPWELLAMKCRRTEKEEPQVGPLCQSWPMARSPRLSPDYVRSNRALGQLRFIKDDERIHVLLVANPSGDLPFATPECNLLAAEIKRCCLADRLEVTVADSTTGLIALLNEMQGKHIIHFAGHAELAVDDPGKCALILGNGDRLRAEDLRGFWLDRPAPLLVFANSCSSGMSPPPRRARWWSNANMNLPEAFLAAGVGNYVGTAWRVPDDPRTGGFASSFYRRFFSGHSAGRAMIAARNESYSRYGPNDLTWARYILYGNPLNCIDLLQRSES